MTHLHRLGAPTAALLAFSLAALALSACGGGSSSSTATTGKSSTDGSSTAKSGSNGSGHSAQTTIRHFGQEATAAQAKQAEAAVTAYFAARAAGEWKKACSYLVAPLRRALGQVPIPQQGKGSSCAAFLESRTARLSSADRTALAKLDVESVRVEGDRGYAFYQGSARAATPKSDHAIAIAREGAEWKLLGISGRSLS